MGLTARSLSLGRIVTGARTVGVWQSLALVAAICAGAWFDVFRPVDGLIADLGVVLMPRSENAVAHRVLIVEAPIEAFVSRATPWELLTHRLLGLGAIGVAYTALPTLEPRQLAATLANPKVDAAAAVDFDADPEHTVLRVPRELSSIDIRAVSHLGPSSLGVHRHVPGAIVVGGGLLPSLELAAANRVGVQVPPGDLLIDFFAGPPQSLPRTTLHQLESGQLIREAVQGRLALIGPVSGRFEATVVTPLTSPRVKVGELEFHAYALDTLLRGATIRAVPRPVETLLIALTWLATLVAVARFRFRRAFVFASLAVLTVIAFGVLLLPLGHIQLPVVAMILVIGTTTLTVLQHKSRKEARDLGSLVTTTSVSLANRWAPDAPTDDKAFGQHLLAMADQLLPLSRSVLLIRHEESDLLRFAASLRCTLQDVAERRRSLRQRPYLLAMNANTPCAVPEFFTTPALNEHVLMLPLIASERLSGFWVFSVDASQVMLQPSLIQAFYRVAEEIAESLLEHAARQDSQVTQQRALGIDHELRRLADNLHAIDRHFWLSEQIFLTLRTPTVVFDLFGRTIAINERMRDVLQGVGDPTLASAPYLLEVLCQLRPQLARQAIAAIVFEGHEFQHAAKAGGERYMLRAIALTGAGSQQPGGGNEQRTQGLQIELFPVGDVTALPDRVDLWDALERAIGRVATQPGFESLEFELDGNRELPPISACAQPFTEALAAVMQLLAQDAALPGTVTACVNEHEDELVLLLYAKGYGVPPESLEEALSGLQSPAAGPLRQIRALRESAFSGGSFRIESELGQGYRVHIVMPIAR